MAFRFYGPRARVTCVSVALRLPARATEKARPRPGVPLGLPRQPPRRHCRPNSLRLGFKLAYTPEDMPLAVKDGAGLGLASKVSGIS